ncbi:MAG TPA: LysR substrate-binding domain-containing protein [Verrucomicrobiae bacterium]|jgi:DNA-binding transcriptional LysR family regulator|nr:LysR substrate-binding domain-containing protein [Verrucomicrobiae bacterium]
MELRHLRYFDAVAGELNFTRAAQKLHVAQPALSRQIRQLEDELRVKLLDRTHRGVTLTQSGRAFLAQAQALLQQSEHAIRVARNTSEPARLQLNLGYIWGLFHSFVPHVLERFRRHCPETAVHLFDLAPLAQARAILEGRLDAAFIGFAHEANCPGLKKRKVGSCTFVAALPKKHPAARKSVVPLETLAGDLFLGISAETFPGASRHVTNACVRAGFRPKILQTVERGYTILGLVAGNCGVALLPESLKALPHPGIVFRPLDNPPVADLFVAWRAGPARPPLSDFLARL